MARLGQLLKKYQSLNIDQLAIEAVEETRDQLLDIQRDQLLHGERKDGSKIGKYKSESYAAKKLSQNPLAGSGNVDLKFTGEYYQELFVDIRNETLVIDSAASVDKINSIIDKYGDPLGLNEVSLNEYKLISKKALSRKIIQKIRSK